MEADVAQIDGGSIPVVLVHGFASSFDHTWRRNGWVDALTDAGRTVIAVDLPGHGATSERADRSDFEDVEGSVSRGLPPGPIDAAGFSAGARILVHLAVRRPGRFRRLALLGLGNNLFTGGQPEPIIEALEGRSSGYDPQGELFRRTVRSSGNDPKAMVAFLRRPSHLLSDADVRGVDCPVLVVSGERDFIGGADRLLRALSNVEHVVLPGADHFSIPRDARAMEAVLRFFGRT